MRISQNDSSADRLLQAPPLTTKKLIIAALLSAISIILTRFVSVMLAGGTIRLGFGNVPIILAGILLGPLGGALSGVVSDLLGILILPQGSFHLGFTLSAALTGAIPGFLALYFLKSRFSIFTIGFAHALVYVIVSLGLNSLWLSQLYGNAFVVLVSTRALTHGIVSILSTVIVYVLCKSIRHLNL